MSSTVKVIGLTFSGLLLSADQLITMLGTLQGLFGPCNVDFEASTNGDIRMVLTFFSPKRGWVHNDTVVLERWQNEHYWIKSWWREGF